MTDAALYGYHGRILEVDLSKGTLETKPLNPQITEDYLGGRGLATRLFYDSVDPTCDPLGEDNVVVLATSPVVGTTAPTSNRGHMVFKSPLTNVIGSTNCGGSWAYYLKGTGYDVLVLKGKASEPVMIDITPDGAKILPAKHLWGKNVHETTELLLEGAQVGKKPCVLCIGPAGEKMVRISAVMNDKNRAYGRCGPGAVFGAKNLKAIRVAGNEKITIKDEEQYKSGLDQAKYLLKAVPVTSRLLKQLGTNGLLKLINVIDMLPHKNFQDNVHADTDLDRISGEAIRDNILERAGACFRCPIACQRHTRIGNKRGEGPEYENTVMLGPSCGIYNQESITLANYAANELGIDTISLGGTIACAMELFERGHLTHRETDNLDLCFGNNEVLEELTRKIASREGVGDKLAEGAYRLAEGAGHPECAMTVKSLEIPAYDPRASWTQALGYVTSPTGACHLRGGYAVSLAFFGGAREIPRFSSFQSPISIRNMQNHGLIQDSLGICRFTGFAFTTEPWARMVSGITGLDFSTRRLEETADRIAALERLFNLEAGASVEDDTLPDRFSEEPIFIAGKDRTLPRSVLEKMRSDYYGLLGWDDEGRPAESLCKKLNIKRR